MKRARPLRCLLVLVAAGAGCSSGGGAHTSCLPVAQRVGPSGAEISISAACDPDLAGTALLIPPGALDSEVTIGLAAGDDLAQPGLVAVGPSVRFTPDGLAFAKPSTLTLPFHPNEQPGGSVLAIVASSVEGRSFLDGNQLTIDRSAALVSADIAHFTDYQVMAGMALNLGDGGNHSDGGGPHVDGGSDGPRFDGGSDGPRFDGGSDGPHFDGGGPDQVLVDGGNIPDGAFDGGIKD